MGRSPQRRIKLEDLRPPKSLEELAREQGVPLEPIDVGATVELLSKVWRTPQEVREFDRFIKSIRRPSRD